MSINRTILGAISGTTQSNTVSDSLSSMNTLNIHGGSFMHVEGNSTQIYHISSVTSDERGLFTLLQGIAPEAMHNAAERYPPPKCQPGTRVKILEEIKCWIEQPRSGSDTSVLWLHAPAGHGKSAIMQTIAELLSSPKGNVVANFFFGRGKGRRQHAQFLFSTIAFQLALSVPGLREHVDQIMRTIPNLTTTSMDFQVKLLVADAFSRLAYLPEVPLTVIIDGLDECSDYTSQQTILELIQEIIDVYHLPLRFVIASRPEPQIREVIDRQGFMKITSRITIADDFTSLADIEKFLLERFADIYARRSRQIGRINGPWPSRDIVRFLARQSCGQFIYATTVLKFLDDRFSLPGKQLDIILQPYNSRHKYAYSDLDSLYLQILSTYPNSDQLIRLLGFIIVIPEPVTAAVLEDLLDLETGEVELILQGMHSLLEGIPTSESTRRPIRISHASFGDFLSDRNRSGQYYTDPTECNIQVVKAVLSVMSRAILDTTNHSRSLTRRLLNPQTAIFIRDGFPYHLRRLEFFPQSIWDDIWGLGKQLEDINLGTDLCLPIDIVVSFIANLKMVSM